MGLVSLNGSIVPVVDLRLLILDFLRGHFFLPLGPRPESINNRVEFVTG